MIVIDLSFPRKHIQNTFKNINHNLSIDEGEIKKCKLATLCTLAAIFSFNNTVLAESIKESSDFIGNHVYSNLFALCEILKQTNYNQISLAIKGIEKN